MSQISTKFITNGAVTDSKLSTGIDAAKIADGSVSSTEFQYINSLTSNAQTQLNGKAATDLSNLAGTTAVSQDLLMATGKTLRVPNNTFILGRNAADNANINIASVNTSDRVVLGDTSKITIAQGTALALNGTSITFGNGGVSTGYINSDMIPLFDTYKIGDPANVVFGEMHSKVVGASISGATRIKMLAQLGHTTPSGVSVNGSLQNPYGSQGKTLPIFTGSDATNDSTATGNVLIETGNKTAGTGNSGAIKLTTGTSSGGSRGDINLDMKLLTVPQTITPGGTTGDQTINKISGTVNFAASATSLTVTNNTVQTTSIVFAVIRTNDSTATIKNVVPASGQFTINLTAAATAETSVGFFVLN